MILFAGFISLYKNAITSRGSPKPFNPASDHNSHTE